MSIISSACPEELFKAVARISGALRKFATAASGQLGGDCFLHMELGESLLADLHIHSHRVLGFAAWRVGHNAADCLGNHPLLQGWSPREGVKALAYHAWLECDDWIIDFTTYQLAYKAQQLDALDGSRTSVAWCPDYLLCPGNRVCTFDEVKGGSEVGMVYYEGRPEYRRALDKGEPPNPYALRIARLLLKNPYLHLVSSNRMVEE